MRSLRSVREFLLRPSSKKNPFNQNFLRSSSTRRKKNFFALLSICFLYSLNLLPNIVKVINWTNGFWFTFWWIKLCDKSIFFIIDFNLLIQLIRVIYVIYESSDFADWVCQKKLFALWRKWIFVKVLNSSELRLFFTFVVIWVKFVD